LIKLRALATARAVSLARARAGSACSVEMAEKKVAL